MAAARGNDLMQLLGMFMQRPRYVQTLLQPKDAKTIKGLKTELDNFHSLFFAESTSQVQKEELLAKTPPNVIAASILPILDRFTCVKLFHDRIFEEFSNAKANGSYPLVSPETQWIYNKVHSAEEKEFGASLKQTIETSKNAMKALLNIAKNKDTRLFADESNDLLKTAPLLLNFEGKPKPGAVMMTNFLGTTLKASTITLSKP